MGSRATKFSSGHLGTVSDRDWDLLHAALHRWLQRVQVSGSIASDYSLYRAIDDEREKAIEAWTHPWEWDEEGNCLRRQQS
jgi:hypothetical protein